MNAVEPLSLADLERSDPHARGGGRERRFCCPWCGGDKPQDAAHRCLSVNTDNGAWVCQRCGGKGKLREWWTEPAEASPRTRQQARRAQIARRSALPPVPPAPTAEAWEFSLIAGGRKFQTFPLFGNDYAAEARRYLLGRGLSLETAAAAGVRFAPDWHKRPAVVFPLRDEEGRLTAAQGRRLIPEAAPKAISAGPIMRGVFATPGAWAAAALVLTEAPIDALSLAGCGVPALAFCGSSMMPPWVPARCAFRPVLLAFDADSAGDKAADEWGKVLAPFTRDVRRLRPEGGKDWNELLTVHGRAWLMDLLASRM